MSYEVAMNYLTNLFIHSDLEFRGHRTTDGWMDSWVITVRKDGDIIDSIRSPADLSAFISRVKPGYSDK